MRDRTADLLRARQALSQLSYGPSNWSFSLTASLHLPFNQSHTQSMLLHSRCVRLALSKKSFVILLSVTFQ